MNHECLSKRLLLSFAMMLFAVVASADMYCSYGAKVTDDAEISVHDLLMGNSQDLSKNRKASFYRERMAEINANKASQGSTPEWKNEYAVATYENGNRDEAKVIWQELLRDNPENIAALGNLATAAEREGKTDFAIHFVEQIVKLRPHLRADAEKYRLMRLKFMTRAHAAAAPKDGDSPTVSYWYPELAAAWQKRPTPAGQMKTLTDFPDVKIGGLCEMLKYNPKFADGWLALGMALEHDGNLSQASVAYEKALALRTTFRADLMPYNAELKKVIKDSMRGFGFFRGLGILLLTVGVFLGLSMLWKFRRAKE
ncbi:MAG: hypothetical protein PHX74_11610 [Candidatus Sumerlaeales bacterium]|nr:hypothetical protein [Candidatus Sumerlaeales bacterium]